MACWLHGKLHEGEGTFTLTRGAGTDLAGAERQRRWAWEASVEEAGSFLISSSCYHELTTTQG